MNVLCMRHPYMSTERRVAKRYRLVYPQPESVPRELRFGAPGPDLWMCDECAVEAAEWAELKS